MNHKKNNKKFKDNEGASLSEDSTLGFSKKTQELFSTIKATFFFENGEPFLNLQLLNQLLREKSEFSKVLNDIEWSKNCVASGEVSETNLKLYDLLCRSYCLIKLIGEEFSKYETGQDVDLEWVTNHLQTDMLLSVTNELPNLSTPSDEFSPKLYVICGPTGSGKSTLIKLLKEDSAICQMPKITTRHYRFSGEGLEGIINIPRTEFEKQVKQDSIYAAHEYLGNLYGISLFDIVAAKQSKSYWLFDTCNPKAAFDLKTEFPDFIQTVLLLTVPSNIEQGLKSRKDEERVKKFFSEWGEINRYRNLADHVLEGNYELNVRAMRKIIAGEPVN